MNIILKSSFFFSWKENVHDVFLWLHEKLNLLFIYISCTDSDNNLCFNVMNAWNKRRLREGENKVRETYPSISSLSHYQKKPNSFITYIISMYLSFHSKLNRHLPSETSLDTVHVETNVQWNQHLKGKVCTTNTHCLWTSIRLAFRIFL